MRKSLVLIAAIVAVAGCGSDDSDDEAAATSTTSSVATTSEDADALVGEWVTENECQALADALTDAGLEEFIAEMTRGAGLVPGKPDPSEPCKGAKPLEHSHTFSDTGVFNSYDENGQEVDFGTYEVTGEDTFTLNRPPFESEVRYQVEGDTATFEVIAPNCEDKKCKSGAALAIATFFPRTYERVE